MTLRDDTLWDGFRFLRTKLTVASLALTLLQRNDHDAAGSARAQAHLREALAAMNRAIAHLEHRSLRAMRTSTVGEDRVIATQVGTPRREDRDVIVDANAPTAAAPRRAAGSGQERVRASQPAAGAPADASGGRGGSRH